MEGGMERGGVLNHHPPITGINSINPEYNPEKYTG